MMKKAILVGVVAVAAMAFSASSAMAWSPSENVNHPDGEYTFSGTLVSTLDLQGDPTLTCDTTFEADLDSGYLDQGEINSAVIDNCETTVPQDCVVDVDPLNLNWALFDSDAAMGSPDGDVTVADVGFNPQYSGSTCGLDGTDFDVEGDVEAAYDSLVGSATFPTGADTLEVTRSSTTNIPVGTDVDLTGTVFIIDGAPPEME